MQQSTLQVTCWLRESRIAKTLTSRRQPSLFVVEFDTGTPPTREEIRGIVEGILSDFFGKGATLVYDTFGKPSLLNRNDLAISYTHSKNCLAIAADYSSEPIGIDTESEARLSEIAELKEMAFSPFELKNLGQQNYVFGWCLKEAAVKRLGSGFRKADPSRFSLEIRGKSYKISLDDNEISQGYFLDIRAGKNTIVICSNRPIRKIYVKKQRLSKLR